MKTSFLFPQKCKVLGWLLFIPSCVIAIASPIFKLDLTGFLETKVFALADNSPFAETVFFDVVQNAIGDELLVLALIIGGLLVGFSKLRNEDEYISQLRYESLVWATYFNLCIILLSTVFVYGFYYFNVLLANIFSLLLFFIIRFHIKLAQLNKVSGDDE